VFRDAESLAAFWPRLGAGPEPPAIDFDREMAVVVSLGRQPAGGHSIAIGRTALRDGILSIEVVSARPSPDCPPATGGAQPADVAAVSAHNVRRWRFVEREEMAGCGG
jgi:hypothetical protein